MSRATAKRPACPHCVARVERMKRYRCVDCDKHPDDYMVHDSLWAKAGLAPNRFCCLECLAKRLDVVHHRITLNDFPDLPVNRGIRFGFTLGVAWRG